jgi:hypothetical protein
VPALLGAVETAPVAGDGELLGVGSDCNQTQARTAHPASWSTRARDGTPEGMAHLNRMR